MSWSPRYSLRFNGGPLSYVLLSASAANFHFGDARTFFCWAKVNRSRANGQHGFFGGIGLPVHYDISGYGPYQFYSRWTSAAAGVVLLTSPVGTPPLDRWYMYTERFSVNGANVICEILVNGRVVARLVDAQGYYNNYLALWTIGYNQIGFIDGVVSGACVVHRWMSDDELEAVRRGFTRPQDIPDVVSFWPFQDGAGLTLTDVVNGYNGTLSDLINLLWTPEVPL